MRIVVSLLLFVPLTWTAFGQVESFNGTDRFSHDAVLLDFQGFDIHLPARHLFANWGITFTGKNGPITFAVPPGPPSMPAPGRGILSNGISEDKHTSFPLLIDSDMPLLRVGFTILTHDGTLYTIPETISTKTTVTAFDQYGRVLGSVVREGDHVFVGLEAPGGEGISRVTIKSDQGIEGIDDLFLDYFNRPQFTTYLPQLADGLGVRSSITFLNLSDSTAQGSIRLYSPAGQATGLGGLNEATAFSLPPRASKTLATSGKGELKTGYGVVVSNCPLQVRAVYTTEESDGTVREAGVVGVATSIRGVGAVLKDIESAEDTAIALVNPNDTVANVWIYLLDEAGWRPKEALYQQRDLQIPPHGQVAMFVSELFPQLERKDFRGTIGIRGPTFAVVVIRTLRGFATSSYPSGDN